MKLWTVVVCHTNPEVIESGLQSLSQTCELPSQLILVDHHYPLKYWETKRRIVEIAEKYNAKILTPLKNMGGHNGFNWAVSQLALSGSDIVIGYDPDSNPLTKGWDRAAVTALADPSLAAVHLMHKHILPRGWKIEDGVPRLATLPHPEMFNVTIWKGSFLNMTKGLKAMFNYYGAVEIPMLSEAHKAGMRMAYLYDYQEDLNSVAHDPEYNDWKAAHISGFQGNFDEYLHVKGKG